MKMTGITVSGLEKRWGAVTALAGIDFDVRAGELVVLLGPSGCGKSTTLRIIAGLEAASAGTIRFGDRSVDSMPAAERGMESGSNFAANSRSSIFCFSAARARSCA